MRKALLPFSRKESTNGIYAAWNVYLPNPERFGNKYIKLILWESKELMWSKIAANDGTTNFLAMHQPCKWLQHEKTNKLRFRPHLSTIHVVKDAWTLEIVVHELQHFIFFLGSVEKALSQIEEGKMQHYEEPYCYLMGMLASDINQILWEANPYGEHAEKTDE